MPIVGEKPDFSYSSGGTIIGKTILKNCLMLLHKSGDIYNCDPKKSLLGMSQMNVYIKCKHVYKNFHSMYNSFSVLLFPCNPIVHKYGECVNRMWNTM